MTEKKTMAAPPGAGVATDMLKAMTEAPAALYTQFYQQSLGAWARALQSQADFAAKLAACSGPAEVLCCQFDYLRSASTACTEEAGRAFQSLQSAVSSGSAR
jgi:hypothetical protein